KTMARHSTGSPAGPETEPNYRRFSSTTLPVSINFSAYKNEGGSHVEKARNRRTLRDRVWRRRAGRSQRGQYVEAVRPALSADDRDRSPAADREECQGGGAR